MNKEYSVRSYRIGDESGIIELLIKAFPEWAKLNDPINHWKWKFLDSPLGTDIVISESGDKIIGVTQNMRLHLKLGPALVVTHFGCDSTTHVDYRGIGVFGKILDLIEKIRLEEKIDFEYALTGNPAVRKEWGKRGRVPFPHEILYLVRITDIGMHLKNRPLNYSVIIRFGYSTIKMINNLINIFLPKIEQVDKFTISNVEYFDEKIEVFWNKIQNEYDFILEKNLVYLNWRYCDPRSGAFVVRQAEREGEVLGFIVLEIVKNPKYTEGVVMDFLVLPNRFDVTDALLREACQYFEEKSVNTVYYMVPKGHPNQKISSRHGFLQSPKTPIISCHVITTEKEFEFLRNSTPNRVSFYYGDTF